MVLRVTTAFAETGPQTFKNVVRSLEASFAEMPPGSRDIRCRIVYLRWSRGLMACRRLLKGRRGTGTRGFEMGGKRLTEDAASASDVLLTVVLYGDGSFGSSMRGSAPGSHSSIKRVLAACATAAVVDTDEPFRPRSVVRKAPLRKGGFPKGKKGREISNSLRSSLFPLRQPLERAGMRLAAQAYAKRGRIWGGPLIGEKDSSNGHRRSHYKTLSLSVTFTGACV